MTDTLLRKWTDQRSEIGVPTSSEKTNHVNPVIIIADQIPNIRREVEQIEKELAMFVIDRVARTIKITVVSILECGEHFICRRV